MFDIALGLGWAPGNLRLFKWVDAAAAYDPASSYPSEGRFGDGSFPTLYLAESAEGAMAEFFRRHVELLALQDDLRIRLFEIEVNVTGDCLDVRSTTGQWAVGISRERLTSSDADEGVRYAECRQLAHDTLGAGGRGIGYPSAGASWETWNLVVFGDDGDGWTAISRAEVACPRLAASDVRALSAS